MQCVDELQALGVMRVATLEDGSLWCLTSADHLQNIEVGAGGARAGVVPAGGARCWGGPTHVAVARGAACRAWRW